MTEEEASYFQDIQSFVHKVTNCHVENIILSTDLIPDFDVYTVPFQFDYSYKVTFITENGNFTILSTMTSQAIETFWVKSVEQEPPGDKIIDINSIARRITVQGINTVNYPFKISIEFDEMELTCYCADIYNQAEGLKYTLYDSMVLFFKDKIEAGKFEKLCTLPESSYIEYRKY